MPLHPSKHPTLPPILLRPSPSSEQTWSKSSFPPCPTPPMALSQPSPHHLPTTVMQATFFLRLYGPQAPPSSLSVPSTKTSKGHSTTKPLSKGAFPHPCTTQQSYYSKDQSTQQSHSLYYAIIYGHERGIFRTWAECWAHIGRGLPRLCIPCDQGIV